MDRDREVVFGKLAIGRRLLARDDAVRCYHQGSAEHRPIWEVAVREGLISPGQAKGVLSVIEQGDLVCLGPCGGRFRIAELTAPATEKCNACGGPLYVARDLRAPAGPSPPVFNERDETWRDPSLGQQVVEALSSDSDPGTPKTHASVPPEEPGEGSEKTAQMNAPSPIATPPPPQPTISDLDSAEDTYRDQPRPMPHGDMPAVPGYEMIAPLGRGGMGAVYRAKHLALGRVVALKLLQSADDDQRARFQREIHAIAKLDHPSIVKVFGAGEIKEEGPHKGKPFFAMDYVDGRDLTQWGKEKPRTVEDCARMVASICDAMDYAHGKMIVHRDLKPQNILVSTKDDLPKICDFGLARVYSDGHNLTRTGQVMGTPQYMPPEQALGDRKKIGPPTDVYALGAILYELLVGRPPFLASRLHALIAMVVRDTPPVPSRVAPERKIPPAIDAIVLKTLEKDPRKRYHTASELGKALREAIGRAPAR